jgi:transposase InsO family protein
LVRNGLIDPMARRRKRGDYRRWERPGPMQLWQMDIMGGLLLADGSEAKLITGVDDHSRFCVIASVVARPTGRLVCAAFAEAMRAHGVPLEVLTDNGKQFTGRFGGPKAGEVLFERVCRENGIRLRHTAPRTPTTTGKIERFHQSVRREWLDQALPFASIEAAQAETDVFVEHYNTARPHQALDMAFPADRFFIERSADQRRTEQELPLHLPASLATVVSETVPMPSASRRVDATAAGAGALVEQPSTPVCDDAVPVTEPRQVQAIEVDRIVPDSGNLQIAGQQVWLGPDRAGMSITLWISTAHLHVLTVGGGRLKTVASRLTSKDLAVMLERGDARPAGSTPVQPQAQAEGHPAVEIDRIVSTIGIVSLASRGLCVGSHLAGQRVTLRLDGVTAQVMDGERTLLRTLRCPLPITACGRLRGARPAGPPPTPSTTPVTLHRVVSSRGGFQVVGQKIQVGRVHARKILDVTIDDTHITIHDDGEPIRIVPRTTTQEITRYKSKAHTKQRKTS